MTYGELHQLLTPYSFIVHLHVSRICYFILSNFQYNHQIQYEERGKNTYRIVVLLKFYFIISSKISKLHTHTVNPSGIQFVKINNKTFLGHGVHWSDGWILCLFLSHQFCQLKQFIIKINWTLICLNPVLYLFI